MPDEHYDDDERDDESSVIRELRKELKQAKSEAAEVKALRQESAFHKAGLDLSPKQQTALLAAHEGDLTAEALLKTATEIGLPTGTKVEDPSKDEAQVSDEEKAALQRIADATAAAEPSEAQVKTLEDEMKAAKTPEELSAILERANLLLVDD